MKNLIVCLCLLFAQTFTADLNSLIKEGMALHDQGRFKEAIEKYKQADAIQPSNAMIQYELCFSSFANKEYANAIAYCKRSIEIGESNHTPAYIQLGTIYDKIGKKDSAVAAFEEGLRKDPNSYQLKYNYGITLLNLKEIKKSYEYARSGTENTRTHEGTFYLAGYLAHQQNLWLEGHGFTLYTLLIGQSDQRMSEAVNRIYSINKSLVTQGKGDSVVLTLPSGVSSENAELNQAFLLGVAMFIAADTTLGKPLYRDDVTHYEFLVRSSVASIVLIAQLESKHSLKSFYEDLVKNKFEEAFCFNVFSNVSPNEYERWLKKNSVLDAKYKSWIKNLFRKDETKK